MLSFLAFLFLLRWVNPSDWGRATRQGRMFVLSYGADGAGSGEGSCKFLRLYRYRFGSWFRHSSERWSWVRDKALNSVWACNPSTADRRFPLWSFRASGLWVHS